MALPKRRDVVEQRRAGAPQPQLQAANLAHPPLHARYITVASLCQHAELKSKQTAYYLLRKLNVPIVHGLIDRLEFDRAYARVAELKRHVA